MAGVGAGDQARLAAGQLGDAERVRLGAQLLDDLHAPGQAVVGELERLGAQPHDDLARAVDPGRQLELAAAERRAPVDDRQRAEVHRRRPDEAGDEEVGGMVVEAARRVALLQARRAARPRDGPSSSPRPGRG